MVVTRSCGSPISQPSALRKPIGTNRISTVETRKTTQKQTLSSLERSKARVQLTDKPAVGKTTRKSLERSPPLKKARVQLTDKPAVGKTTRKSLERSPPLKKARVQLTDKPAVGKTTRKSLEKSPPLKKARVQLTDKHVGELGYSLFNPVALDAQQLKIWWKFQATDETVKVCDVFRGRTSDEKDGEDVDLGDDIVTSLVKFAVDTYNKSYKLHVDANEDAAMAVSKCVGCYYYKMTECYYIYLKLKASEVACEVNEGDYEAVVSCEHADGSRTLTAFSYDYEAFEKILLDKFPPEPEDVSSTESDAVEAVDAPSTESEEDVPRNPKEFYEASGMVLRRFINGYNFFNPLGKDRCVRFRGRKT